LGDFRNAIYIPPHFKEISENAKSYGETVHFPEAIYQYVIGWFDGDVTTLFRVAPKEEAMRLVEFMGGPLPELNRSGQKKVKLAKGTRNRSPLN